MVYEVGLGFMGYGLGYELGLGFRGYGLGL